MIRAATDDDAPAIADIVIACWRLAYRGILPDAELDRDSRDARIARIRRRMPEWPTYVADPVVGFVRLAATPAHGDAEIEGLYVHPDAARGGIGRALLAHACSVLAAQGKRSLYIHTLRDNRIGRAFYAKLGGRVVVEDTCELAGGTYAGVGYCWDDLRALSA